ncbi:hypothetical protein MU582_03310 [Nocardioidaceae bacterium SCSIO 66511]|nr:hypothetical protein MU582_03310 [Nocardioidaceae bacterium SCSIO 66511]
MRVHRFPRLSELLWVAGTVAATTALYVALLGWHAEMTLLPNGECHGPYEPWQVMGVAMGLALVVSVAAWHRHAWSSAISCVLCLTVLWSFDSATVSDQCPAGANLWPLGAALLFTGSALGLGMIAGIASYMCALIRRRWMGRSPL